MGGPGLAMNGSASLLRITLARAGGIAFLRHNALALCKEVLKGNS